MNGYVCFWKGKRAEIEAETSYQAQLAVEPVFQKMAGRRRVNRTDITVILAEKSGKQIAHWAGGT